MIQSKVDAIYAAGVIGVVTVFGAVLGAAESGLKGAIAYGLFAVVMGLVVVSKED